METKTNCPTQNRIIFLIYVAAITTLSFFHEYWRDELQSFMLVRSSHSIAQLLETTRYEGHPSLWFFLLYGLKLIAPGLLPMKILHLLIAAGSGWFIIRYSPFRTYQKILLLAGYFFFFEYSLIVRNYAIGVLFILAACALFPRRESPGYFTLLALTVAGIMLSNFYAFFVGFAFLLLIVWEDIFYRSEKEPILRRLPGYLLMGCGIILFFIDTIPPADYGYAHTWNTTLQTRPLLDLFARVGYVFIPVPVPSLHFWNTVIYPNIYLQAFLGVMMIIAVVFVFAHPPLARGFILVIFILIMAFSYLKFKGYFRHNGHLYIAFIAMMWIQPYLSGKTRIPSRLAGSLFTILLILQAIAGVVAVGCELAYPFSQAENAASYIKRNFPGSIVVAHEDTGTSAVAAFLYDPLYYPQSDRFGTFLIWNTRRLEYEITPAFMVHKADSLAQRYNRNVILLCNSAIDRAGEYGLVLVKSIGPSVEPLESYWLYTRAARR